MSNELSNANTSKTSLGSYALMPSVYVGVNLINNARHFKNPFNPLKDIDAKKFKELTKGADFDVFQRAQFSSESFETVRRANIEAKKIAKLEAGKLPLKDRFLNLFRKNKVTGQDIIAKKNLKNNLDDINTAIKSGNAKKLQTTLGGIDEGYTNAMHFIRAGKKGSALKSFGTQVFDNFKKEFSFKKGNRLNAGFNIAMTAIQFVPNVIQKVVPAFKNNGFKAGMTELGQTLVQAGADLAGYAAGGAIGRTLGSAVGAIAGPVGAFFGGLVGDMVGSMFVGSKVCGVVEKVTNKDDFKNTGNIELASEEEQAQIAAAQNMQQTDQAQTPQQTQETLATSQTQAQNNTSSSTSSTANYASVPSREEIKRMAYSKAFPSNAKRHAMNSYIA